MNIEDLFKEWEVDSEVDNTNLAEETRKIPKLQSKYMRYLAEERILVRMLENQMQVLKLDKNEFYTSGPTPEQKDKGWKIPARGVILKGDIPLWMAADKELIDLSLKIGMAQEKVEFIRGVIYSLKDRGFNLRTALEHIKFTNGA